MLGAPACANPSASCTSGPFLAGRGPVGPEPNQPNAIDGCADGAAGTFHVDESIDELKVATLDGTELTEGATVAVSVKLWAGAAYASDRVDLYTAGDASAPQWNFVGTYAIYQQGAQTLIPKIVLPAGATQVVRAVLRQSGSAAACTAGPYDDHDDLVFAVRPASGPPPTIAITAPADGQTIRGSTSVTVAVTNAAVIEQVELLADGVVFAADATAPYYALYDPLVLGTHVLVAQARDVSGNVATSEPVTIFAIDGESPTVRIVSPAAGEHVSGTVTVTADATDDVAVQSVEFFADSRLLGSDQSAPYQVTWATSGLAPGAHTLFAQAYDTSNNVKGSDYVTVYVDGSAPSVSILSPPQYATVSGTVPEDARGEGVRLTRQREHERARLRQRRQPGADALGHRPSCGGDGWRDRHRERRRVGEQQLRARRLLGHAGGRSDHDALRRHGPASGRGRHHDVGFGGRVLPRW